LRIHPKRAGKKKTLENCALSPFGVFRFGHGKSHYQSNNHNESISWANFPAPRFSRGELIQVENAQKFIVQKKFSLKNITKKKKKQATGGWVDFTCHRLLLFALCRCVRWKSVLKT